MRLAVVPVTAGEAVGSYVIGHAVGLEKAALRELAGLWAILGAATLAVIAVVGWLVTGELVRPLARLRAATARTDARDLSARIAVTGEDEIAALTTNFNAMLDRLQEAFEAQRPLHADSHRLTEARLQLVENAVAYSEPGSTIRIGSSAGGGEARLWVADRGRGIEAEHLDHVFDRFARAATDTEGSGLGLTIVRAIVEAHGGRVEVDSEPGVGSTFTLVLPAPHAEEVETWPAS